MKSYLNHSKEGYQKFTDAIVEKEEIKKLFDESEEINIAHAKYTKAIGEWWDNKFRF